ncbi:hypothetical protein AC630_34970 [Bradyrhizobium sp. AS23.2]|nr:hypothetical protein AC630_34970 [Bradyrhizobium sp. AS23.2]
MSGCGLAQRSAFAPQVPDLVSRHMCVVDLRELIIEQLQRIALMRSEMVRSHHQKTQMHLLRFCYEMQVHPH